MNFLFVETLQGSTRVDQACILNNRQNPFLEGRDSTPLLLLSCHDAVHGYSLEDDDSDPLLSRTWSCPMLDRMDGLVILPPQTTLPSGQRPVTDQLESRSKGIALGRVLMLTSEAVLELYSINPDAIRADVPIQSFGRRSGPLMELTGRCPLSPPSAAAPSAVGGRVPADCLPHVEGTQTTMAMMPSRRPEGPVWSSAAWVSVTAAKGKGSGGERVGNGSGIGTAVTLVSAFDDFLHVIRVVGEEGPTSGPSDDPSSSLSDAGPSGPVSLLEATGIHLGCCSLSGTAVFPQGGTAGFHYLPPPPVTQLTTGPPAALIFTPSTPQGHHRTPFTNNQYTLGPWSWFQLLLTLSQSGRGRLYAWP